MKMRFSVAAFVASCTLSSVLLTANSAHSFFLGDVVTAQIEPGGTPAGSFWNSTPTTAPVIDPGVEFVLTLQSVDKFEVDLTSETISLTYVDASGLGLGAGEELTLSGLSLPGGAMPFSLTNNDAVDGIEAADISLSGDTLTWDLNDTGTWFSGNQVIVTFVPEPCTLATGMIAACTLLLTRRIHSC